MVLVAQQTGDLVEVRSVELDRRLERVLKGLKNLAPLHKRIGVVALQQVTRTFVNQGSPQGSWARLAPSTIKYRSSNAPILMLHGGSGLMGSWAWEADSLNVKLGTALFYSVFHQLGTRHMPARPMLPEQDRAVKFMTEVSDQYLKEIMGS